MVTSFVNIIRFINTHPLSSKNKWKAYKRFITYQLQKRFLGKPIVVPFTSKTQMVIDKNMTGATGNLYCGLHEFTDMSFLLHFLRKDDLFVDVGANIGSYTVLASGHIGSRTICFEPVPETANRLKRNIKQNQIEHLVTCQQLGVASEEGEILFTTDMDTTNHVALEGGNENVIRIQVTTLDHALSSYTPVMIKIDVEGYEVNVLNGAHQTLSNPALQAIIIELNGSGKKFGFADEEADEILRNHQFQAVQYLPFERKIIPTTPIGTHNTIYIRDIPFVSDRLLRAEKFQVIDVEY